MPAACIPCLSPDLKKLINQQYPGLRDMTNQVQDCPEGMVLEFCLEEAGARRGGKGTRASSPRSRFMSTCLKGKHIKSFAEAPAAMRACSAEWREQKGR